MRHEFASASTIHLLLTALASRLLRLLTTHLERPSRHLTTLGSNIMLRLCQYCTFHDIKTGTDLFIWIHGCKATLVTRLAPFRSNVADFVLGAVGEVAGVGVVGHFG